MSHFHDPFRPTSARPDADGDSEPRATVPEDTAPKVPSGTTKEVLEWVDGDKERAQAALDKEQSHESPRKGLVSELTDLVEEDDDDDE